MVLGIVGTGELRQEVLDLALEIFETSLSYNTCDTSALPDVRRPGGGGAIEIIPCKRNHKIILQERIANFSPSITILLHHKYYL